MGIDYYSVVEIGLALPLFRLAYHQEIDRSSENFQTTLDSDFKCNTKIPEEACQGKSVSHQQWFSAMKQDNELKLDLQNNYKGNVYEKNT